MKESKNPTGPQQPRRVFADDTPIKITTSEPPFLHTGRCTTITDAIQVQGGEAEASRQAFEALSQPERDALIEFLKSLRVLPTGSRSLVLDEFGRPR